MNVLTVQEVGERLGMSENTVYKLLKTPDFPKIQIGIKYFIPEDKFEAYIMQHNKERYQFERNGKMLQFRFNEDFAGNFESGQTVCIKETDNGYLVDGVVIVDKDELLKHGEFI